ncbi:MAG: ClbS/DfsB family four-helix bundle protein [Cyclobacteriaceae bacterium]
MPRPKTKAELLESSQKNFERLKALVNSFSQKEQEFEFPGGTLNRNICDVLAHLYHWHLMMMEWYSVGMSGLKPDIPAKSYTWKTVPELNYQIWENYKNESLSSVLAKLNESHLLIMQKINQHTNDELFEKKRYRWTGTISLGAYLISSTSSHYDWAYKLIRKSRRNK